MLCAYSLILREADFIFYSLWLTGAPSLFILQVILTPVEVAIEDMRDKINKLKEVLSNAQDTKLLQMQLQGGIATSVNQGPYAIAHAFLGAVPASEQNHFHQQLRMCFREFVKL